ncbi:MAG: flagellar hook-associated protein FlgK [Acidobacteriaceae bacterium]|nr:flagellar hook-associated protein FlgK [Acidobacteriaceae bacterium]
MMGTLLSMMSASLTALQADQAALNVTANNVANQNVVGYTRQVVQFSSNDSVSVGNGGVSLGRGAISVRDRVLEQRVQQQTQTAAQSAALETVWQQVENVFSLSTSSTSNSAATTTLGAATDGFFSALSALASNPSDTSMRQAVLTAAGSLAAAFNSAASQLAAVKTGLDQQVVSVVGQVNTLTASIAKLNGQIAKLSPNADAGVLEDQRQAAIAALSQYIGVDQITTENNGITLTAGNGQLLVSGDSASALTTSQVGGSTHIVAGSGQDITGEIVGGELGGIVAARDTALPTVTSALDTLANAIATSVNAQSAAGVDGNGNAGQAVFTVSGAGTTTAATISVAFSDPALIAAASSGQGSAGAGNAQALANLSTSGIVGGATASDFYASLLSQIGNAAASASADSTQQQTSLTQLTTQRDALSGVSLDQEAANLTQYQRSYEAAAKVFSIVNTLLAEAINLGQATTVA